MTFATQDGYVVFERDPQTGQLTLPQSVRDQFYPEWLRTALASQSSPQQLADFEREYWERITNQLLEISTSPLNWQHHGVPVGQVQAKFGNTSVPIKEVLLVSAAYTVPIFLAVSALVTGPASLVLAAKATAALGPATAKLYNAISTYTPTQLDVHTAVVAAMYRNASKTLKGEGATLDEILQAFQEDPRLIKPPSLKAVLDEMASEKKKMLLRSTEGGVEVFRPNAL